jgi:hypothetical protein
MSIRETIPFHPHTSGAARRRLVFQPRHCDSVSMMRPEYFDVVIDYADEAERMLIGLRPASRAGVGSPSSARPAGVRRIPTPAT